MMRRALLTAVGVLALALAAPAVASAHGHHHKHHGKHHRHKAHRSDVTGTGAAATIASFDGTTLTLTLANGSTVSGAVTDHTWIVCKAADPAEPAPTATAAHHGGNYGDDDGDWRGGHGDCGHATPCDASDLVAGASVDGAWLRLGSDGLEFAKVDLISAAS
jgi:hypothetical protein